MTTQTVLLDLYDYGASGGTVTVRDPEDLSLVDTADSVTKSSEWSSRYVAVFTRGSVLAAGVYPIGVSFNGIPFLMYVTLTGVDGEVALARSEKAAVLDSASRAAILTQEIVESYPADAAAPTLAQAVMLTLQHLQQKSVSGTTVTIKKLDKSTTAATYTLDSATDPTSITRAS